MFGAVKGFLLSLLIQIIQVKNSPDLNFILILILLFLLILLSALASGSEAALFSLNSKEKRKIQESDHYADKIIQKLLSNPRKLLGSVLVLNNLVNIAIIILFTLSFNHYFRVSAASWISFLFEVVFITFLLVVFGELFPKMVANQLSFKLSRFVALPVLFFYNLFSPLTRLLLSGTKIIDNRIRKKNKRLSAEEIRQAIDITGNQSQGSDEKNILKRIVSFGNVSVKQIMTPRINVVAVEKNISFDELLNEIKSNKFSRIPVFNQNPDNIIGILYIKDLLPYLDKNSNFNWNKLIRPAYFVPETKKIDDLLRDFQAQKVHMAVVFDEFGGFSGIATLEDVLEEIIGEISDEFDENQLQLIKKTSENTFLVNASTSLTDTVKALDLSEDFFENYTSEVESIGGLVVEILGNIPEVGQLVTFKNLEIKVTSADERKINELSIKINQAENN